MGFATLSPMGSFEVGTYQCFKMVYTAGKFGIDDQGGLRIGFRGHFDGSKIQFDDPKGLGFTTVTVSNGALTEVSWETRRNIRPWNKSLYIRCLRFLREGDQIEIITSEESQPSPLWQRFAVTSKVKSQVRRFFRTKKREEHIIFGKQILISFFKKENYELNQSTIDKIKNDFNFSDIEDLSTREFFEQTVEKWIPMKKEQTPEDIGNLAAFLASDEKRFLIRI